MTDVFGSLSKKCKFILWAIVSAYLDYHLIRLYKAEWLSELKNKLGNVAPIAK
jgi:hypothetical protein